MHMYRLPRMFTERSSWPPPGGSVEQPINQTVLKILALTSILVITIMMAGGCSLLFSTADPLGHQKPNSYTCQCTAFISNSGFCGIDDAVCTFDSDCTSGTCSNNQSICSSDDDCSGAHTCEGIGTDICVGAESIGPKDFNICVPDQLNPNKDDGEAANDGDLDLDCSARVQEITVGIVQQCTAESLVEVMCEAAPASTQKYFDLCDEECAPELLSADGNNCDIANITVDTSAQDPVCLSEDGSILGVAGLPGVAAALRSRSTCDVAGEIIVTVDGDQKTKPTQGVVEFIGEPCPGQSCDIGMFSRIDEVGTFKFSEFFGVASTEIKNIRGIGSSLSTAIVDATGTAAFYSTLASGRGKREDFVAGVSIGSESASIVAVNDDDIDVTVNWTGQGASCMVDGALLGQIEGSDASVIAVLAGGIVNEPPRANAGGHRSVECTSPAGAIVTLDAGASTDPQGNIALVQWRLGQLTGPEIGVQDEVVQVAQALGVTEGYYLNVMDNFWQISTDNALVSVVDTTSPEITCPATQVVECTGNGQAPITYQATASDICWESLNPMCNPPSGSSFALGDTTVSCSAADGSNNSSGCSQTMTVVDTTPPVIESLTATPNLLWPPNHKMKRIKLDITATDICDPMVQDHCRVVEVVSNEPDAGLNEDDIPYDVEIVNADTVRVRAERDENGQGRTYTVTVECTDSTNSTQRSVNVFVSHDERE